MAKWTLKLTLDIHRHKQTEPEEPHPEGDNYTTTERADKWEPIGFIPNRYEDKD